MKRLQKGAKRTSPNNIVEFLRGLGNQKEAFFASLFGPAPDRKNTPAKLTKKIIAPTTLAAKKDVRLLTRGKLVER